jgi:pantoate kinase
MAQTPEGKVKDKIKKILKAHNIYFAMPMGTGFGNSGVPDFLCCFKGRFLAIEAKADAKSKATALQVKHGEDIDNSGGMWWIVNADNIEVFELWIKEN